MIAGQLTAFTLPAQRGQLDALDLILELEATLTTGGPLPTTTDPAPATIVVLLCTATGCRSVVEATPSMPERLVREQAQAAGWQLLHNGPRCRYHHVTRTR